MNSSRNPLWRRGVAMMGRWAFAVSAATLALSPTACAQPDRPAPGQPEAKPKPTIVLVHGAWSQPSIWSGVVERLEKGGYEVVVPPNPLRGVASDSSSVSAVLRTISGPVVLVGHSYGGFVVTNAAAASPNVEARVYVDGYIPDAGDSVSTLGAKFPGGQITQDALDFAPVDGGPPDVYVKRDRFPAIMAADLPPARAAELAAAQRPLSAAALEEPSQAPAASETPTYALVGTEDRAIPPATLDFMAERAHATTVHVPSSHLSLVSQPDAVGDLIIQAANQVH